MSDVKEISLPPHVWEALETMSLEMGVGRDSLVSQAVFTLARLNGYVVPGKVSGADAASNGQPAPSAPSAPKRRPTAVSRPPAVAPVSLNGDESGNPFEEADGGDVAASDEGGDEEDFDASADDGAAHDAADSADAEEVQSGDKIEDEAPVASAKKGGAGPVSLTLVMAGREPFKLDADSMLVGRGKHCDYVIESNRVSREHARISRDAGDFVLEDLNSSNGTFFGPGKEKMSRPRKIKDGDEFTFGTEKVKFRVNR